MKLQSTARSYAQALMELGKENGVDAAEEIIRFSELINGCNDLENLLFLEVFSNEEKELVLNDILEKGSFSPLIGNFFKFILNENRIGLFPLIYKEIVVIDDHNKGFIRGIIEGRENEISDKEKEVIKTYIENRTKKTAELIYNQSSDVTAGYRVTVEDLQLDASVDNQFNLFKKSIIGE